MAIIDMRNGDPVELDPTTRTVVFLLPTQGFGRGYAAKESARFTDESRVLGKAYSMAQQDRVYLAVTVHTDDDYSQAPKIIEDFLNHLDETHSRRVPIAMVISGRDIPVEVRFEFMATLARSKQRIKLFDFSSS